MSTRQNLALFLICLIITGSTRTDADPVSPPIPYVASDDDAVRDMLSIANVGPADVVYDLGSGDGRIPIAAVHSYNARRAVGIEIDTKLIDQSRINAKNVGLTDHVDFIQGDLFTKDFRQADVVTLFLGHRPNITLRPKIFSTLKPGTRIVSHQFGMGEWAPDKKLTIRRVYFGGMYGTIWSPFDKNPHVPDYTANESTPLTNDKIFMWTVPASVAGIWQGKIKTARGTRTYKLILHQQLSKITAEFQLSGHFSRSEKVVVELLGNHIRIGCTPAALKFSFDGHINGDSINGTLAITDNGQVKEQTWKAKRDKTNLTGTWQWPCATGSRMVKLRIKQDKGHLTATYIDRNQEIPITDFYDFGGGFYFTLMIGRKGNTIAINDDTGWLIGRAVRDQDTLKGNIKFHPYSNKLDGEKGWTPELLKP